MTAQELFDEWLSGRLTTISETSYDLTTDYERLIPRMHEVAEFLGIEWKASLIPEYIQTAIDIRKDME